MDYKIFVKMEYKKLFKHGNVLALKFFKYKRIKIDKWGKFATKANEDFNWIRAEDWCKENCKGHFAYWEDNWLIFELKQDAFLFKLHF